MGLQSALTIDDLKRRAKRRVPKMFFDYADSGALTEQTYNENETDFSKIRLRQRVAVNMQDRTLATTMVGQDVSMPMALAPTGLTGMQIANGEMLAAKAAEKAGIPFALSTMSICSIEDVASVTTKPFWFQLYVMRDQNFVRNLLDRARAAGCSALVLTMDLQLLAQRHKDLRNGLSAPPKFTPRHIYQMMTRPLWCMQMLGTRRHSFRNIVGHAEGVGDLRALSSWTAEQFDPKLSWDDIAWIRDYWGGTLIIKGVLDKEDAIAAAATGADALIVSNHGGRQLDGAPSAIRVLPEIVEAVGDKIEVHMDGGIRNGQDILKARALGARGTFIGRPFLYGLGAGGEAGVTHAIEILRKELDTTMALCGERDIANVGRHNLYSVDF
ncbi:alpha-hydroxy acid oxidase [Mariluticola halotolerans]|uniref:alpha-hydroxy acid oxidase n=1 Tax=Mariluticola halotolerans TaxID=2909283 RepID=UPI003F5D99D1|nr:alpha-hydroxy-acid oxidizing protein [Mariluticola halotolerans]